MDAAVLTYNVPTSFCCCENTTSLYSEMRKCQCVFFYDVYHAKRLVFVLQGQLSTDLEKSRDLLQTGEVHVW